MRKVFRTLVVIVAVVGVFAALSRRRARADDDSADDSSSGSDSGRPSNTAIRAGSFDSWPPVPRAPERGSIAG